MTRKLLGAVASLLCLLLCVTPAIADTQLATYRDFNKVSRTLGGVVLFNPDGTVASLGGGGSGGAVTVADGADTAEGATNAAAYTDTSGAASGTLTALNKGQFVKAEQIRALLASPLTISNTAFGATQSGTWTVNLTNGSTGAVWGTTSSDAIAASSTAGFLGANAYGRVFNGTTWDRQRGDTSGSYIAANVFWTESTATIGASGSNNFTLRTNGGTAGGVGSRFAYFIAESFADQTGTLYVDKTTDGGTTWRQVQSTAQVANTTATLKVPVTAAGYRARFVNGSTAQGAFLCTTAYSLN